MNRPRIALLCFSPLRVGGVETHLLQIMEGMRSDFEFLAIGDAQEPFTTQARDRGARVLPLRPSSKFDARMIWELDRVFRRERIGIVHTHEARAGLLARTASKLAGRVSLHTIHTPAFFLVRSPARIWAYQRVERLLNGVASDAVVFVSPAIRDLYARLALVPPGKSFLIPNGLEKDWFQAEREWRPSEAVQFVYVGRLAPEKDLPILFEAFQHMLADHPRARLRIVGSGPLEDELVSLVGQRQLQSRVQFLGRLSREQGRQILRESDVFVLPSRFESMSYTLLEAMACGLACVATDVGGNADLLAGGAAGLLVAPADALALEGAMRSVAGSVELRRQLGRAARERASQRTVERMLQSTRELYFSLLAAHRLPQD
ncbi:MAG: glycosyltransferase [Anaerolineales bacterium]